jgi:hypothetical protein
MSIVNSIELNGSAAAKGQYYAWKKALCNSSVKATMRT